jgi:hypothetical protein
MPLDITGPVSDILKEVENDYISNDINPSTTEDDETQEKFTASSWRKSKNAKKALAQFKAALTDEDEIPEDDVKEEEDEVEENEQTDEDDEVKEETDEPFPFSRKSKKARASKKASAETSDEITENDDEIPPEILASLDDVIDEFIDELDELPEDEKEALRDNFKKSSKKRASSTKVEDFLDSEKAKKALAKLSKKCKKFNSDDSIIEKIKNSDPDDEVTEENDDVVETDGISPELFKDIVNFVKENPELLDEQEESVCPICGETDCSCEVEEADDEIFTKKSRKNSDDEDDDIDEDDELEENEDASLRRNIHNAKRRAKRKSEKLLQARFNQWKNNWKAKCGDDLNEAQLFSLISKAAKTRTQAVKEAFNETLYLTGNQFGSLTETETKTLVKTASNMVNKFINESSELIKKDCNLAAEKYISSEVIPNLVAKFDAYKDEVMRPELYEQFEGYMNYVVKHLFKELKERKLIIRSKQTENLAEFTEELLGLIKKKLQILPEREDALTVYEEKVRQLSEMVSEEKVRRIKTKDKLIEAEKELWIYKNIPDHLSESKKDSLRVALSNLDESLDFDKFIVRATKLINEISAGMTVVVPTKEPQQTSQKSHSMDDFINKASELF